MPTYDDEKYLSTAIEAILSQSFQDFELIVVNDASPDNSDSIIRQYQAKDKRIVYLKNDKNLGTVKSCNKGSKIANGDYMYHASSDDKILPGFFEEMMSWLLKYTETPICTSDNGYFYDGDETTFKVHKLLPDCQESKSFSASETMNLFKTSRFIISGHSTIFKRNEGEIRGYLSEELGYTCDFVLYNSMALTGGLIYIPKTLSGMRLLPKNQDRRSKQTRKEAIRCTDNWICYVKKRPNLWKVFYQSTLLARTVPSSLYSVFLKPKHWDIMIPLSWMKIKLLLKRVFGNLRISWTVHKL